MQAKNAASRSPPASLRCRLLPRSGVKGVRGSIRPRADHSARSTDRSDRRATPSFTLSSPGTRSAAPPCTYTRCAGARTTHARHPRLPGPHEQIEDSGAGLEGPHRDDWGDRMSETGPDDFRRRISLRTTRMEALSDGIFAIAATLLVLDLVIPDVTSKDVGHQLVDQWPSYVAYLVSFATIGNAWLNHSVITEYLERADAILLRLNLALLFFVSVLPFPTHMLAEYLPNEGAERIAVTVYGLNLLAISGFIAIVWHYALWQRLVTKDNSEDDVRALTAKLDPSLVSYAVVIGLGLWQPKVAVVLYLVIALFMIIPFRSVLREARRRRRS